MSAKFDRVRPPTRAANAHDLECPLTTPNHPIFAFCTAVHSCTTSPEEIEVMKLEGYSWPMCNKHVHLTMTRSSRFHCLIGVIDKPTTDVLWVSPVYTDDLLLRNFLNPQCRNCSHDPDHASFREDFSSAGWDLL